MWDEHAWGPAAGTGSRRKKDQPKVGARWALEQVRGLLREEAPGFHLYALNQSASTLAILEGLKGD